MSDHVLEILEARGFVAQLTGRDEIHALLAGPAPQAIYTGYDPTGASLHVGHLLTVMAFRHLQRAGHRPLVVLGGGTARVGDPSGKVGSRPVLSPAAIASNQAEMAAQLQALLAHASAPPILVDNAAWLEPLRTIDFLREIGRHFSVNRMLAAEAYRARLARGLSFIEFNYQLLQAYDFLILRRRHGCLLQLGGDDQWGNILAGVELCRREDRVQVHGMTYPLLTTAAGAKMGKTEQGAVWLDAARTPPAAFYQYWVNCDDADVGRFLRLFTCLPLDQIAAAETLAGHARNAAKRVLAYEVTAEVHGAGHAVAAHVSASSAFGAAPLPAAVLPASGVPRGAATDETAMPSHAVAADVALAVLIATLGHAPSRGAARRLIEQGAVSLGGEKVSDPQAWIRLDALRAGAVILRVGRRRVTRLTA